MKMIADEITGNKKFAKAETGGTVNVNLATAATVDSNGTSGAFTDHKAVERWFIENAMSIEQTIETLIAAVFGMAYRQKSAEAYELHRSNGNMLVND